jgi:hypothetical protein
VADADARAALAPLARRVLFEADRRRRASRWVEARGGSMRPLIAPGMWMLVDFGALPRDRGEIVLVRLSDTMIAHRLVATARGPTGVFLITKGDAEAYFDRPTPVEDVFGVVHALRRPAGEASTTVGCAGRPARLVARVSGWSGRAVRRARRLGPLFPAPLRRLARAAAPRAARAVTRLVAAPLASAARLKTMGSERG